MDCVWHWNHFVGEAVVGCFTFLWFVVSFSFVCRKSALNRPVVYSTDRSKAVVPVLVLLFVALRFILRGNFFMSYIVLFFVLLFSSPFSIAITSLGGERENLSAFHSFVRFALVWCCLFPLPLGIWEGLRFVIVALSGLFSYLFIILLTVLRQ